MAQKMKSNGRAEYTVEPEQLCWNCKRCTNLDNLPCPWAENFTPVEGWTATPGRQYFDYLQGGGKEFDSQTYAITACPLFIQDKPFSTLREGFQYVSDALDLQFNTVRNKPIFYFKKYEEEFGKKLPYWLYAEVLGAAAESKLEEALDN